MDIRSQLPKIKFRYINSSSNSTQVRFRKDHLSTVTSHQSSRYNLEVINNGKLGYSSSNQPDEDLADKALVSSNFGDVADYDYPTLGKLPKLKLKSSVVANIKTEYMVNLGKKIVESIKEVNSKILVDVSVEKSEGRYYLETSSGIDFQQQLTSFDVYAEGELVNNQDFLNIGQYFGWRDNTFDLKNFTNKIKAKFKLSKKVVKISSGKYSVMFSPEALVTLLDFVETALSAQVVYKKVSKWQNLLGKVVVDHRLTIIDDPTVDFALGSTQIDSEGFVARPVTLVEKGICKNYYTDLKHASKLKIQPNGRGFGLPASPDLTNLVIEPGGKSTEKIIKNMHSGLIIEQVIGGGQDNPYSGDFTLNIHLGFLVKGGQVVGRIKDCLISGNVFEMLRDNVQEISSDREWYGGSAYLPAITFSNCTIVAKK